MMVLKLCFVLVICNVFSLIIIMTFCLFLLASLADSFDYLSNAFIISPYGKSEYCTDLGLMIILLLLSS